MNNFLNFRISFFRSGRLSPLLKTQTLDQDPFLLRSCHMNPSAEFCRQVFFRFWSIYVKFQYLFNSCSKSSLLSFMAHNYQLKSQIADQPESCNWIHVAIVEPTWPTILTTRPNYFNDLLLNKYFYRILLWEIKFN
jgi:hypothetical protein